MLNANDTVDENNDDHPKEPKTFREAMDGPDREKLLKAAHNELCNMNERQV
jgi:hypothetical protein